MSEAKSYYFSIRISSGALYHLVATWFERHTFLFFLSSFRLYSLTEIACFIILSSNFSLYFIFTMLSLILFVLPLPSPKQVSGNVLESPKSQILMLQKWSTKIFSGLISLWITFAELKKLAAQSTLYIMVSTCYSVKRKFSDSKSLRS